MKWEVVKRVVGRRAFGFLRVSGFHHLLRPVYGGLGCVLMFHRVCPRAPGPRLESVAGLEVTPEFLDEAVRYCLGKGYAVVSPDDVHRMLTGQDRPRRFVCFTVDDGYRDTLTAAYPVFKKHQVPFAVYVATGFPEGRFVAWWFLLEELLAGRDEVVVPAGGKEERVPCASPFQKEVAFYRLRDLILAASEEDYLPLLERIFDRPARELYRSCAGLGMSWEEVHELARDQLVTVGAHTVRHMPLSRLTPERVREELTESKKQLEAHTGRPVLHLSYPFGGPGEAGAREFAIAAECGFRTAFVTRVGNVFAAHAGRLLGLPRNNVSGEREGKDVRFLSLWLSGTVAALENKLARIA
jgi:peptidoglycan/xylan/chitin deacetylase (PgdA/CDA1 family)